MPKRFPRVTIIFILLTKCKAKLEAYWCSDVHTNKDQRPTFSHMVSRDHVNLKQSMTETTRKSTRLILQDYSEQHQVQ